MEKVVNCKQCGSHNPNDAQFCIICGLSLTQVATGPTERLSALPCSSCKALSPSDAHFCVSCGYALHQVAMSGKQTSVCVPPAYAPIPSQASPQPISKPLLKQVLPTPALPYPGVGMLIVGVLLFFVIGMSWWWIIPLFLIYQGLVKKHTGISKSHVKALLWFAGTYLLFTTGSFWPIILLLFFLSMVLDHIW